MPTRSCRSVVWNRRGTGERERVVPEEVAVAFTYGGSTQAVMMATPQDLEDFAVGFSLTEGLVSAPQDIRELEIVEEELGIELRMWLDDGHAAALAARRRRLAGPTGCGLCGIESLAEAVRPARRVTSGRAFTPHDIMRALDELAAGQELNRRTHALHAAGFWRPEGGYLVVREDVGRHNAFDKLAGALARAAVPAGGGMVVTTSRVSVELIQKAAVIGAPVLVAVSAPTALSISTAEAAGISLVGVARSDGFEVFSHPDRVVAEDTVDVV